MSSEFRIGDVLAWIGEEGKWVVTDVFGDFYFLTGVDEVAGVGISSEGCAYAKTRVHHHFVKLGRWDFGRGVERDGNNGK